MNVSSTSQIAIYRGKPESPLIEALEVDVGSALPVAWTGLRVLIGALQQSEPAALEQVAQRHPQEWNHLFPGFIPGEKHLADLALTPSERRLHRESEQVYRVLNTAAEAIVEALRGTRRTLVLRNTGHCDLVSLRGLMRACEWLRLDHSPSRVLFADWDNCFSGPDRMRLVRELSLNRIAARLGATPQGESASKRPVTAQPAFVPNAEQTYLQLVMSNEEAELRIAAAMLALRSCFYSTNYEGALLAIGQALDLLDAGAGALSPQRVQEHFAALDDGNMAPAIEIAKEDLGAQMDIKALLWKSVGVVYSFVGDHPAAFDAFNRALDCPSSPELRAQLHMYLGLTLAKRMGRTDEAVTVLRRGLELMKGRSTERAALEEAWLRNVMGLTFFQQRDLQAALREERLAASAIGQHHTPIATHLKINLISNISVLQEMAKRFSDAIQTWSRFEQISSAWGENFRKHHAYRMAGLQLSAGDEEAAIQGYQTAYESAVKLNDCYHRQIIASELGRFFLEKGEQDQAVAWFEQAYENARAIGDPLKIGESMIGQALSCGEDPEAGVQTAQLTTTYRAEAQKLLQAYEENPAASLLRLLPRPRTKLNRPFDLVNLNL